MPRRQRKQYPLPSLPDHPQREVEQTLGGAYRNIRLTTAEESITLSHFFQQLTPLMLETVELLSIEPFEVQICPKLTVTMDHLHRKGENIFLSLKSHPLTTDFVKQLASLFEEKMENFTQRGSEFQLHHVQYLEWEVLQYREVPHLTGH